MENLWVKGSKYHGITENLRVKGSDNDIGKKDSSNVFSSLNSPKSTKSYNDNENATNEPKHNKTSKPMDGSKPKDANNDVTKKNSANVFSSLNSPKNNKSYNRNDNASNEPKEKPANNKKKGGCCGCFPCCGKGEE